MPCHAQLDTITLDRLQCEALFLKQNLNLLAEALEINKAEAKIIQASLWPNPSIAIDEVNLWATPAQLGVFGSELPAFGPGNVGRNQQFTLSVEQLIITAGKRKKLLALEQTNLQKSKSYYEELLRNLKLQLRLLVSNLNYQQATLNLYSEQLNRTRQLAATFQRQVDAGNVARGEFVRLKALELELTKQRNNMLEQMLETQKELRLLLNLPAHVYIKMSNINRRMIDDYPQKLQLKALLDTALTARPDLKLAAQELRYAQSLYEYEKLQRVPNVTLRGGYDRGGNFMYNFVGFGAGIELPLFNRNQGNIKFAQEAGKQANIRYQLQQQQVENEVAAAFNMLQNAYQQTLSIENGYENTLDAMYNAYTKNYMARTISMLEYLDFVNAYLENKKTIIEVRKTLFDKQEELNYAVGKDLF